jgi:hypothetical protein
MDLIVKMNMGCCQSAVRIFLRYSSGRLSAEQLTRDSAATSSLGESPVFSARGRFFAPQYTLKLSENRKNGRWVPTG